MLKSIPPILSPERLRTLCEMGHGDERIIEDGNFPAESIRAGAIETSGRFAFRERVQSAYAVVAAGETAICINLLLRKGVVK